MSVEGVRAADEERLSRLEDAVTELRGMAVEAVQRLGDGVLAVSSMSPGHGDGTWAGRRRLSLGHSLNERCAECDRILGDLNVLAIDDLDASWCLGCVEDFLRRARAMEDEYLRLTGGPFMPTRRGEPRPI